MTHVNDTLHCYFHTFTLTQNFCDKSLTFNELSNSLFLFYHINILSQADAFFIGLVVEEEHKYIY